MRSGKTSPASKVSTSREHLSGVEPATQPVEEPAGMAAGVGAAVADEDGWLHGLPVLIPLDGAKCSRTVAGHAPRRECDPRERGRSRHGGAPAIGRDARGPRWRRLRP